MNETGPHENGESAKESEKLRLDLIDRFTTLLGFFIIGRDADMNDSTPSNNIHNNPSIPVKSAIALIKEQKKGGLYGAALNPNAFSPSLQTTSFLMDSLLHRDDSDSVGGSLISVPALDLQSSENEEGQVHGRSAGASAVLPSLGKSSKVGNNNTTTKPVIPAMVASVLGHGSNSQMNLFSDGKANGKSAKKSESDLLKSAAAAATDIEYAAAQNFGKPISYTRSSAPQAPGAMARVLFDSFSSLIESRIKTWTVRLLRHSLSSGDEDSRVQLLSLLAAKSIQLSAIVTQFKTMRTLREKVSLPQDLVTSLPYSQKSCEFVVPLIMDVNVDLKLHGKVVNLHFQTDGTAAASFHKNSNKLIYFDCKIDANSLVSDMIAQARLVVLKTVAQATLTNFPSVPENIKTEQSLAQFGSSLNLSNSMKDDQQASKRHVAMKSSAHMLQPTSSALRLSKRERSDSKQFSSLNNGRKRDRDLSVTWDSSVNDLQKSHSLFKKPKIRSSMKRSIKSFGKPGADHFQSAKNATFAEFGHLTQNPHFSTVNKKRSNHDDVSVKSHHLSTMNLGARHSLSKNFGSNKSNGSDNHNVNASFDLKSSTTTRSTPPSLVSSYGNLCRKPTFTELARNAKYSQPKPRAQNNLLFQTMMNPEQGKNLKRTPTMLENILLKKTQDSKTGSGGGNADWGL